MVGNSVTGAFVVRIAEQGRDSRFPEIEARGIWREAELSQHQHGEIRLLVYGHCLLSIAGRAARLADAVGAADRGRGAVDHAIADWPGSYSAVLLHGDGVTAYADTAGQFPLYYSRRDGELLLGSDPAMLAARHGRQPDPVMLAAHIGAPSVLPLWWGRSPYVGISRLEGGMVLRDAPGTFTAGMERLPLPVPGRSLAEGAAALRDALTRAIRMRCLGQPVSADFSGGLDSSTAGFLAASCGPDPVMAIVYHQPLAPAQDLTEASRFAVMDRRVSLRVVRGTRADLPFASLAGAQLGESGDHIGSGGFTWSDWPPVRAPAPEPELGSLAVSRSARRLAAAASTGSRLHLTGEGGDAVLLAPPSYLASLARRGSAWTLLRHCGGYSRLRYTGPTRLVRCAVRLARTTPGQALGLLAAELRQPTAAPPSWADLVSWWPPCGEAATWLSSGIRQQLADIADDPAPARLIPDGVGPADLAALADLRRSGDAQRHLRALGQIWDLPVHAPFLDTAVIRAGLGVPAVNRADPWAYKPMLRQAMAGLVPNAVLGRQTKGDYSAEDYRGARIARDGLRELLRDSRLADLGIIEPRTVRSALDRMAEGIAVPLGPLNMLLATETWLRGIEQATIGAAARWRILK
jgi:asparagine synthase (glutamine-hydrolysing)